MITGTLAFPDVLLQVLGQRRDAGQLDALGVSRRCYLRGPGARVAIALTPAAPRIHGANNALRRETLPKLRFVSVPAFRFCNQFRIVESTLGL